MNMGFAWRTTFEEAWDRTPSRETGRAGRVVEATRASASVYRALLRRPEGGTVVVLVPRDERPIGPDTIVVEDRLRAVG